VPDQGDLQLLLACAESIFILNAIKHDMVRRLGAILCAHGRLDNEQVRHLFVEQAPPGRQGLWESLGNRGQVGLAQVATLRVDHDIECICYHAHRAAVATIASLCTLAPQGRCPVRRPGGLLRVR